MALTKDEIISAIKEMNVVDLADLVKSLEDEFGVTAAAPVAVAAAPAGDAPAAAAEEEKTEFEVHIREIGPNKINVIKAVREVTSLGPARGQGAGGVRSGRGQGGGAARRSRLRKGEAGRGRGGRRGPLVPSLPTGGVSWAGKTGNDS